MLTAEKSKDAIGVLLIDDHAVIRSALRMLIDRNPNMVVVGEAGNTAEALEIAGREQPEIILLDLCLGAESGMDLIPQLQTVSDNSRIIVLTAVKEDATHQRAIRQGANGVVSKEAPADFLMKAIDRVNAGELWLNRHSTANLVSELRRANEPKQDEPEPDVIAQLTSREREVITLVGEGMKNKQIADKLCISETTVRHHLTSILKKLQVSDRLELLIFAYRNSLVTIQKA
jgi:RNA polymerase sigma factor (sigma-70 family)